MACYYVLLQEVTLCLWRIPYFSNLGRIFNYSESFLKYLSLWSGTCALVFLKDSQIILMHSKG